jgi:regulator of protease activity HflC (stomatin/prohibitin superfamily)
MPYIIIGIIILAIIIISNIKIVPQAQAYVIERLGTYKCTWETGLHMTIPVLDRVAKKVSLKEAVIDFQPQSVITKDNVSMQIDTVVYLQVMDPALYLYGVNDPLFAVENLTATTLRNIIGEMELDETLTSRDLVNAKITEVLDKATDKWGIKVNRVEVKNIIPPREIQQTMEKQMKAERDRRETLLEAEGHKQAIVTREEGNKQAKILTAEAEREAAIARAQGQAKAIELVYNAQAEGLKRLMDVAGPDAVMILKKLEALEKLGDGRATKIIVPTDLTSTASDLTLKGEFLGVNPSPVDNSPKLELSPKKEDECCEGLDVPTYETSSSEKSSQPTVNQLVVELHKRTDMPYTRCLEALKAHNFDIFAAENYLKNE